MPDLKIILNGAEISVPEADVTAAVTAGKLELKNEELILFKKPEFEARIKTESDSGYVRGKIAGEEMLTKEIRKELGVEVETKDRKIIFEKYKETILKDAKIEPSKALQEKETMIEQLRGNLAKAEEEKTKIQEQFATKEKQLSIDTALFTAIPEKAVSETISKSDIAALFKSNGYSMDIKDGKVVVMNGSDIIKNEKTLEPTPLSEIVSSFVVKKGLLKTEGGRGGGNEGQDKPGSMESFVKEMETKGHKPGSLEFNKEMVARVKNKTLNA